MPLTDEELADSIRKSAIWRSSRWHLNPKSHAQFLDLVWTCIQQYTWIPKGDLVERWESVSKILKKLSTDKAIQTRKKNSIKKKEQEDLARQSDFFK
jgi:hypothetical protein